MTRIQDLPLEISLLELKQFLFSVRLWRKFYRYFILFTKSFSFQKTIDINLLPPLFWWILDEEFEMKSHNQWPWKLEPREFQCIEFSVSWIYFPNYHPKRKEEKNGKKNLSDNCVKLSHGVFISPSNFNKSIKLDNFDLILGS